MNFCDVHSSSSEKHILETRCIKQHAFWVVPLRDLNGFFECSQNMYCNITCSSDLTLDWMPMPSPIDCRHGSQESLHVPVLSRDVSSPSLQQFQLSKRIIMNRQNSSSLTVVFLTMEKESCFPTALFHRFCFCMVLSWPVAVCVHFHEL